jgi:GNAT superfamily N-acetyltransferase
VPVASRRVAAEPIETADGVVLRWRGPLTDWEMVDLVSSHGGTPEAGWWDQIRPHSRGWVTARIGDGIVVGFVNIVSDGGDHAFLIDTKTRGAHQRSQIGTRIVKFAAERAKEAGCEWLHVDFDPHLRAFYFDACGFQPTDAGLIHLASLAV